MSCTGCATGGNGEKGGCGGKGGCGKMEVHDWLSGVPLPGGQTPFDVVEVRFKSVRKGFYRNANALSLMVGDVVTVEAASGYDVGTISLAGELVRAQMRRKAEATDAFDQRKVLRKSTQQEIDRWHEARQREEATMLEARRICREAGLDMKVSDVEYQGDGTRATVYYTAEERVDFRDAVRGIATAAHARVDMKQIGARQEAARLGGIGPCGRELCCSTWLTDLRSVTTSAARYQQLALNPQKLAGLCGKLKCCLNYELDMYIEAIKAYPSPNAKLKTRQGTGVHMKTDIFKERMWYMFKRPGEPMVTASFPVDTVREILVQNKEGIEPEVDLRMADEAAAAPVEEAATDYANVIDGADDLSRFDKKIKAGGKRRGRDNKKKRKEAGPADGTREQPRPHKDRGGRPGGRDQRPAQEAAGGQPGGERRNRDARGRRRKGPRPDGAAPAGTGPKPNDS